MRKLDYITLHYIVLYYIYYIILYYNFIFFCIGTANENILQEIRAEIRTNEDCAAAWGEKSIKDTNICNSDGSSGSCSVSK